MLASVKFAIVPPLVRLAEFSYGECVGIMLVGSFLGICIFYLFGKVVIGRLTQWVFKGKKLKVFTKRNRAVVRFKNKLGRWGVWGIAFMTPVILSIPIGSLITAKYYGSKKTTIYILLASATIWSLLLPYLVYIVNIKF